MPSRSTFAIALLLSAAAAVNVSALADAVGAATASAGGGDTTSQVLRKFAELRQALPAEATVRVIGEARELDPSLATVVDRFVLAVQQQVRDGRFDALPADLQGFVEQVAEGYVLQYPQGRGDDLPLMRERLLAWWGGVVAGHQLAQLRYAMAPHLVVDGGAADFVVGDFSPGYDYTTVAAREGLELAADFGGGAVLFRPRR